MGPNIAGELAMTRAPRRLLSEASSGPVGGRGVALAASACEAPTLRSGTPHILLVEPGEALRQTLSGTLSSIAAVESHGQFTTARERLRAESFDFLVTNIRLGAYSGLHLAYLRVPGHRIRVIVYSDVRDPGLAREIHRAGAFHEVGACLPVTLSAYLTPALPKWDRRDPAISDRRSLGRGGRRSWDRHLVSQIH